MALPVLFRLWRGQGTASQVELAAEMVKILAAAFPGRVLHGTGDAAFHGESLVMAGTTWTTRLPANAVLYGPRPPRTGKRGRPRAKGDRAAGKQILGAGDACNRTEKAVTRTVPFGFLIQSLLICWYTRCARAPADIGLRRRLCPWYRAKTSPSPAGMLAALRRGFLNARISAIGPDQANPGQIDAEAWACISTAV